MTVIHICTSSDNNYAPYAGTMFASILLNSKKDESFVFHLLDGGIGPEEKMRIEKLKTIHDFEIVYYPMNNEEFANCPLTYLTIATYYRLKIASFLKNVSKVIYLDCDMIIKQPLSDLWDTDISNYWVAGVQDPISDENMKRMGIPEGNYYFNAGMLLLNLDKWRKDEIEKKLFEYLDQHPDKLRFQDQDLLNKVLYSKSLELPLKWNSQYCVGGFKTFEKAEYLESLKNPAIIHYIMSDKPWKSDSLVYRRCYFIEVLKRTPWYYDQKLKYFLNVLCRYPAIFKRFLVYWYKHPFCFVKVKSWRKLFWIINPLSAL